MGTFNNQLQHLSFHIIPQADSFIKNIAEEVIIKNPAVTEDYKNGKEAALQFLVGQGMKLSGGKANPEVLQKLLKET